jgi:hypothetical protein
VVYNKTVGCIGKCGLATRDNGIVLYAVCRKSSGIYFFTEEKKMDLTKGEQTVINRLYKAYLQEQDRKEDENKEYLKNQRIMKEIIFKLRMRFEGGEKEDFDFYIGMRDYYENLKIKEAYEEGYKTAMKSIFEALK